MCVGRISNLLYKKYYGILRRYDWSIQQYRNFMRNLFDTA